MDPQETTTNNAALIRGASTVKQSAPLSQGFQARAQVTPTGFPRYPVNNGPIGGNRPAGQQAQHPIYGLERHSSIGQSKSSQQQLVQLRPHGLSPRPPGNNQVHSPRQIQTRQNPVAISQGPRFPGTPPGVRIANPPSGGPPSGGPPSGGPPPVAQPVGPRPNYQRNVIEQRTEQRILNSSASASTNQPQAQSFNSPRPLKNSVPQRPRNDPSLNTARPCQLSHKENNQSVRPRIIIEKMPDLDEEKSDLVRENSIQKKKADVRGSGENDDDDDDVVMDTEKSPRQNGSTVSDTDKSPRPADNLPPNKDKSPQKSGNADRTKESLSDSSVSPKIEQKMEDSSKSVTRPGTATIDTKSERKSPERMIVPVNDNEQPGEKETSSRSSLDKSEDKTSNKNDSIEEDKSAPTKNDQIGDVKDEVKKESSSSRPASSKMEDKIDEMKNEHSSVVEMKINEESKSEIAKDESKEKKIEKDTIKVDELTTKEDSSRSASPQSQTVHSAGQNDKTDSTPSKKDQIEEKLRNLENLSNNLTPQNVDQMPRTPSKSPPSPDIIKENKRQSPPPPVGSPSNIPTPIKNSEEASKTPSKSPSPDVTKGEDNSKEALSDSSTVQSVEQRPKTPAKSPSPSPTSPSRSAPSPSADVVMDDKRKLTPSPSNNLTMQNLEQDSKTPSKSSDISRASTPTVVDVQAENKSESLNLEKPSRPSSALSKDSTSEKVQAPTAPASSPSLEMQEKLSLPESLATPPKSPQESVKGFDNGQRRSLSSPGSPKSPKSPKSAISIKPCEGEKKKTTFAEDSIIKKEESLEEKTESSSRETSKPTTPTGKPRRAQTPVKLHSEKRKKETENDSASNDLSQHNVSPTTNGVADSPTKKSPSKSKESDKRSTAGSPTKSPSKSSKSLPKTPETPSSTGSQEKKKVPMNKVQVGAAPSPNLKTVRSKIGSLENASYKPGGGKVKIENRKLDFSKAQPKIAAKNEKYTPSGGDKKISQIKLQWNAKPKVGSLDNATYKPGGGDKKIETVKLDFKDKAKPKVGSKDNAKHVPGGGSVKIQTQKVDIKAESKIGSMDNVKHKPGGGDKKIFNDKDYLRQTGSNVESLCGSGSQVQSTEEQITDEEKKETETRSSELPQPPPSTPTRGRTVKSPSRVVTAQAVRSSLAKSPTSNKNNILPKDADSPATQNLEKNEDSRNEKNITEKKSPMKEDSGKSLKPPSTPPRPPNNLRLKNINKTSPGKMSPNELRLPKLATSPVHQEINTVSETSPKLILPKLIESSIQSTRVAQ
ncbi:PREDICTED: microtubule-associated protein tau isoform X3 [Polistes canadensis]|uniref:microtubule-associated protein tau isoform X3 n=1 Tax=Polistes canadensis TaxID=91411 RepID=UPI000718E987|nr:PREDICTED: microtubule-associated protein tau isoform X3 [Polistes canadensis]